ncbi:MULTISPECIES: TRAP transporter small permease [Ramlibacter]|uniref:TRAP transporter small permease protein n=1 Tax=Ramlibacter pinisoli TaxID=2682844 RepID=A0A6N8J122_9BURK|nr:MULTISPECIES: TRAP transporter small permease [Ramlibacter]MBA2962017.1 TRAP transporter small permease [Ramlibacter sp. CGMCC 1.13660]MVQ31960.1 TRAP transporter small permease subunit [Ramlibacter pinisoli]
MTAIVDRAPPVADTLLPSEIELDSADADAFSPTEGLAAAACRHVSEWIVVALVVMMGVEMVARTLFGWSIQFSNEVGGYALVAITFLSLASGQLLHAYHRVHFVEARLSPRGRAALRLAFDLASALVAFVLAAEMVRFEWLTWKSGDVAATELLTPLWMPRLILPVGCLVLAWAMLRTLAGDWKRLQAAGRA